MRWGHPTGPNALVVAVGGGWVVVAPQYGPLIGLDLATGREVWRSARLRLATAPVVASDRVVTATRDGAPVGFAR